MYIHTYVYVCTCIPNLHIVYYPPRPHATAGRLADSTTVSSFHAGQTHTEPPAWKQHARDRGKAQTRERSGLEGME